MKKSVVIATHVFSPGTSQAFYKYCRRKKYRTVFIEHALFGNPLTWFWGSVDTFWRTFKFNKKFDLYLGSNRLNAAVGIILKKAGRVKKVIYFSPDWSENRFNNKILNYIFQKLDYFCLKYSDIVWNSSHQMKIDPMMRERLLLGYPKVWLKKQIQLPDGCDLFPVNPLEKIDRYRVGFVGHLIKHCGVQLAIDSYREIVKKIPRINFLIIGSGEMERELRDRAKGMNFKFTGFIGDIAKVYGLLSGCAIAMAPYEASKDTISQYTDPGKVKNYFSVGLPVVITKVPKIAIEVNQTKSGIAVNYNIRDFSDAVVKLIKNDLLLREYRKNVLSIRKKYSWNSIFDKALSSIPN